jgi:hypothetical protein
MIRLGIVLSLGFIALRWLNVYGDPVPWSPQRTFLFTVLSFLRTTKYPPSLAFLLMTMGPALLLLAWFDGRQFRPGNPFVVFGRVPLFFFLAHLFLLHAVAVLIMFVRYGDAPFLFTTLPALGGPRAAFPADLGSSLAVVYLIWVCALAILYPVCRWFGSVKLRRDDWWLSPSLTHSDAMGDPCGKDRRRAGTGLRGVALLHLRVSRQADTSGASRGSDGHAGGGRASIRGSADPG